MDLIFHFSRICFHFSRSGILGHMLDFLRTVRLFSKSVALFYILTIMRLPVFHIFANIFYCLFDYSHPSGCEMIFHCIMVLIYIALANDDDNLFMCLLEIHRSPLRNVCLDLCLFFNWISIYFCASIRLQDFGSMTVIGVKFSNCYNFMVNSKPGSGDRGMNKISLPLKLLV